jgi:hypothetical protein
MNLADALGDYVLDDLDRNAHGVGHPPSYVLIFAINPLRRLGEPCLTRYTSGTN